MGEALIKIIVRGDIAYQLLIEKNDWELVKNFSLNVEKHHHVAMYIPKGLQQLYNNKRYIKLHRFILGIWDSSVIDHIDGNPLNNMRSNLRITDIRGNARNNRQPVGKSGFRGVYKLGRNRKWAACISYQGKNHYLGLFATKEDAALRWNEEALKVYGPFAGLNILKETY